jgi:hypothetical protein
MTLEFEALDGASCVFEEDGRLRKSRGQREGKLSLCARIDSSSSRRSEDEDAFLSARLPTHDGRAQAFLELPQPRHDACVAPIMDRECVNGGRVGAGLSSSLDELGSRWISTFEHERGRRFGEHVVMAALRLRARPDRPEKQDE